MARPVKSKKNAKKEASPVQSLHGATLIEGPDIENGTGNSPGQVNEHPVLPVEERVVKDASCKELQSLLASGAAAGRVFDLHSCRDSESAGNRDTERQTTQTLMAAETELTNVVTQRRESIELLGFILNQEEYAIQIGQVKEIIRPVEITRTPKKLSILIGIISLRGVIVPVFNLKSKLTGFQAVEGKNEIHSDENQKRIVIIQVEEGLLGFQAEGVTEVIKIGEEALEPPPPLLHKNKEEIIIRGVARYKGRLIILLHLNRVMDWIESDIRATSSV